MWIISMGNHVAVGGISERRRSSCSSYLSKWAGYLWLQLSTFMLFASLNTVKFPYDMVDYIMILYTFWQLQKEIIDLGVS